MSIANPSPVSPVLSWRDAFWRVSTPVNAGLLGGLLCGALVGGVGGRLAMLLLRLTSNASLHGVKTNDDFTIGQFSGNTVFLVVFTAFVGGVGGLFYVAVRGWFPLRWRAPLLGLFGALVGGAGFIDPSGVDFTRLEPLWLAVAFFVTLPAAYGVALSLVVERSLRSGRLARGAFRWVALSLLLLVFVLMGPFGIAALLVIGLATAVARTDRGARAFGSAPVTLIGRTAFVGVMAFAAFELGQDVAEIL